MILQMVLEDVSWTKTNKTNYGIYKNMLLSSSFSHSLDHWILWNMGELI